MQNVMHIATNSGHTVQNDGRTMQNDGRTTCHVGRITLNVSPGPKGGNSKLSLSIIKKPSIYRKSHLRYGS